MSDKTHIEWTDATWNPVTGCSKVSQGCKNCYAERDWQRLANAPHTVYFKRDFTDVQCHEQRLQQPGAWKKPRRIFVNSMSDLFHEDVPDAFIAKVFSRMSDAKQHTFQVLTKRPQRMREWFGKLRFLDGTGIVVLPTSENNCIFVGFRAHWPLPNVWLGVSVEDQATADLRIPDLLKTPAAVRWLSAEPLLGPISFEGFFANTFDCQDATNALEMIDWVVVGGESGTKARPMHADWARMLRDQCAALGVPFLFKQWGEWAPNWLNDDAGQMIPGTEWLERMGKKIAGRSLDGVEHNEYPEVKS